MNEGGEKGRHLQTDGVARAKIYRQESLALFRNKKKANMTIKQ